MAETCIRCNKPGAGSRYNGQVFHMSCKLEQKLDDGVLSPAPVASQPRLRGTGNGKKGAKRYKRT